MLHQLFLSVLSVYILGETMGEVLWEGQFYIVYTWDRYVVLSDKMVKKFVEQNNIPLMKMILAGMYYIYYFLDPTSKTVKVVDVMMPNSIDNQAELIEMGKRQDFYSIKKMREISDLSIYR